MPIIRSVLLLLLLDLLTKHAFRFYEQNLSLELALIEGYLYVDEVVFNYGNISLQSDGDDVGFISLMFICLFAIVAFAGSAFGIATLDEEDSKLTVVPSVLMIAGIIGNTFERIIYGNVCDWITFTRPESEDLLVLNFLIQRNTSFSVFTVFGFPRPGGTLKRLERWRGSRTDHLPSSNPTSLASFITRLISPR